MKQNLNVAQNHIQDTEKKLNIELLEREVNLTLLSLRMHLLLSDCEVIVQLQFSVNFHSLLLQLFQLFIVALQVLVYFFFALCQVNFTFE
jgi:hypothetical protein